MNKNQSTKTLFVIGNGFDIYHNYNSRYSDFKKFLMGNNYELIETLERYISDGEELWCYFEEALANLNTDQLSEDFEESLVSYGDDNWSDAYHHEYEENIRDEINKLTDGVKIAFYEWIRTLSPGSKYDEDGYEIDDIDEEHIEMDLESKKLLIGSIQNSKFLNFNYTSSLEKLYGISPSKITHIHGKVGDNRSNIILGHGVNPKKLAQQFDLDEDGDWSSDPRVNNALELYKEYYKTNSKPIRKIIEMNKDFFESLEFIEEIYILGHSLSKVDIPYIETIVNNINLKKVKWIVSYYGEDEKENHKKTLKDLGINKNMISLVTFDELRKYPSHDTWYTI